MATPLSLSRTSAVPAGSARIAQPVVANAITGTVRFVQAKRPIYELQTTVILPLVSRVPYAPHVNTALVERRYSLRDREVVLAILNSHADLVHALDEASKQLHARFPHGRLFLSASSDDLRPEAGARLVVSVTTDLSAREAVAKLREFDYDWWLEQPQSDEGLVLFTVE